MQQHKVVWFAIFFSTILYAAIAYTTTGRPAGSFEESLRDPIVLALYAAALGGFVVATIVPARVPERSRTIVALALFESCAVFGLVAAFIGNDYRLYFAPWALALIGFLRSWPGGEVSAPSS